LESTPLEGVQERIQERDYRFTLHAGDRMTERGISVSEVEDALLSGNAEVIEEYPEDPRSPSFLAFGTTESGRPLHIQCTYPPNVVIITAYEPNAEEWIDLRARRGDQP
jgi:hypothetical protein